MEYQKQGALFGFKAGKAKGMATYKRKCQVKRGFY